MLYEVFDGKEYIAQERRALIVQNIIKHKFDERGGFLEPDYIICEYRRLIFVK